MKGLKLDFWIIVPIIFLSVLSLIILGSTTPDQAKSQLIALIISSIAFYYVARSNIDTFFSLQQLLYIGSIVFLILPFMVGLVSRGATRWIQIGSSSIQPSEIIKPFLLLTFVSIANSNSKYRNLLLIASFALPAALIFAQPDLGTALVIGVGWLTIFISRMRIRTLVICGLMLLVALLPIYRFVLHEYQRDRIVTFIDPYKDPLGKGYHVIQSIIAVGSGQLSGRGLGHGSQSDLRFLPESHTDFIFANLSESFGFVGAITVLGLYVILLTRIYRLSQSTNSRRCSQWLLSVMAMLAFQIWVNIGMNIGLAPVTGITLPFLSYGGSSLLSLAIIFALVNSIGKTNSVLV